MLFCRSLLRAAETAATLSGSRISTATRIPANAGGAPINAVATSTATENFFASSTTASNETQQQHGAQHQRPIRHADLAEVRPLFFADEIAAVAGWSGYRGTRRRAAR